MARIENRHEFSRFFPKRFKNTGKLAGKNVAATFSPATPYYRETFRSRIKRALPWSAYKLALQLVNHGSLYECPVCHSRLRRLIASHIPNDKCPVCHAASRERLVAAYIRLRTTILSGTRKSVLHVAPERGLAELLTQIPAIAYTAADYVPGIFVFPKRIERCDLTCAPYGDASFDVVIANHVLEHIPDDRAALAEVARMLKPGGLAILLVPDPHRLAVTDEDPSAPPEERLRRFGQIDHVRLYGRDVGDRIASAGLKPCLEAARDLFSPAFIAHHRLEGEEIVVTARKPAA